MATPTIVRWPREWRATRQAGTRETPIDRLGANRSRDSRDVMDIAVQFAVVVGHVAWVH